MESIAFRIRSGVSPAYGCVFSFMPRRYANSANSRTLYLRRKDANTLRVQHEVTRVGAIVTVAPQENLEDRLKTAIHNYLPAAAFLLLAFCTPGTSAHEDAIKGTISNLVSEDLRIPSDTPGIELFLRNKHPKNWAASTGRVLLYVHGATYPSETAFDLRLDGMSWMDYIAAHG